jgi:UDP-N-acetylmuramoylalanine--D-glutamate ligase
MDSLKGKKVLVIGLGISGRSAVQFLLKRSALVSGVDQNRDLLANNTELASLREKGLKTYHASDAFELDFDLVLVSPGVPQTDNFYAAAKKAGIEIIGEVELACRFITGKMVGITGTNGKTTVTMLVEHVLNESGFPAHALGNSGVAITSEEAEKAISANEIVVAELSSFQLETMHRRVLDAAVVLNVTPDHLDRYASIEDYAAAKIHIADCIKQGGEVFVEDICYQQYKHLMRQKTVKRYGYAPDCEIWTDTKSIFLGKTAICPVPQNYSNKKSHDLENLMAAFALCHVLGVSSAQFQKGIATFKKPAHRIEFVKTHNGITYYDDSKGTNIDAVIRAVETMPSGVILIAGGVDKGAAYTPWISAFANKVKLICAIGQAAPKIQKDLSQAIPVHMCNDLQHAVVHATGQAQNGDIVLLSPGCSSFDMFRDYAHRGEEFKRIVKSI